MAKRNRKRRKLNHLSICTVPDGLWKRVQHTDLASLILRDQAIAAALAIYNGDSLRRAELESRVLALQDSAEIAEKMAIPEHVVCDYQDWFYDVTSNLEMTSWIAHEVIRWRPTGELHAHDVGVFLRWVGYAFGPVILESFLAAADAETLQMQGVDAYWKQGSPLHPDLRLLVLAQRISVPKTCRELNRLTRLQVEIASVKDLQTEDLLTPLTLEFPPFVEIDETMASFESQFSDGTELLEESMAVFDVAPPPVVQTLICSPTRSECPGKQEKKTGLAIFTNTSGSVAAS